MKPAAPYVNKLLVGRCRAWLKADYVFNLKLTVAGAAVEFNQV